MAKGEIIVTIQNGQAEVESRGVKGSGCKAITAALEKDLGTVTADRPTREMHEKPQRLRVNQ